MSTPSFHLFDYLILGVMFAVSFIIGMYYAYVGRNVKSAKEYFTAGGNIGIIPATISLLASILCSIWYVGVPVEMYNYGFHFLVDIPIIPITLLLCGYAFVPVFYELQVTSATEYLEKRFNKFIRLLGACLYLINSAFYVALVMFIPALAISQVIGVNIWISITSMCIVGTVYTALGGIRAVMWTDVFQTLIIYSSLFAIAIKGTIDVGGIGVVWDKGVKGERISIAPLTFDPRYRYSIFWLIFGEITYWMGFYGTYQTQIQRYLSCPTIKAAQKALWINIPALIVIEFLIIYIGLILYASFSECDPLSDGKISTGDELLTYFVLKTFNNMPGMAGLFVAGIFSGALSTVSSCLNSMAAVTVEDFILLIPRYKHISEETKTTMSRWIACAYGLFTMLLMVVIEKVESIMTFWMYNNGAVFAINMSLFTMGMFCPWVNSAGALFGFTTSLIFALMLSIGGQFLGVEYEPAPMSTENCYSYNFNFTNGNDLMDVLNVSDKQVSYPILYARDLENNGGIYEFFKISPLCVQPFTFLVALVVGMITSRLFDCNEIKISDIKLYSPFIRNWVKSKWIKKGRNKMLYIKKSNEMEKDDEIHRNKLQTCEEESLITYPDITNVSMKEALNIPNGTII